VDLRAYNANFTVDLLCLESDNYCGLAIPRTRSLLWFCLV